MLQETFFLFALSLSLLPYRGLVCVLFDRLKDEGGRGSVTLFEQDLVDLLQLGLI